MPFRRWAMAREENKRGGGNPICVAFVGIDFAEHYVSSKDATAGLPMARNTNTPSRKAPRPNSDSRTRHNLLSTNFKFSGSAQQTLSHSRSNGSILAQRKWNILLFSHAYRANTIAGSIDIFAYVEKEKGTRRS
jgi:hypothetical protein